ncbi:unnamed protein product [Rhizoctonia solani]|uniref:Uncharacterized protein n=1 Tax=Rhizoctonia solani TaxID=456999 RepID=A0A8H2WWF3_9AGAM|nr:unnamed protein product [Rhizoctonia solani]
MKIATLFILTASYVLHSLAQVPSVSETEIMTIQPVTPIIPSSSLISRTSSRIGGSQVQPSSFSTSRLTISDVSTDRPTPTTASTSSGVTTIPSTAITSIASGSTIASGSNAASSPTATSNAALERFSAPPLGFFGTIVAVGGIVVF